MIHRKVLGLFLCFTLASCVSVTIGSDKDSLEVRGLVNAYATLDGLEDRSGPLFEFGLFTSEGGRDELFNLEIGPLASVGVGLVGARVRVLPLEIGIGSVFYNPSPRQRMPLADAEAKDEHAEEPEVEEVEEVPEEGKAMEGQIN